MVPFRLTVLGPPELHAPNGEAIRFRTRKHMALLIFLAVEPPTSHRRDRLAALFWGESDLQEARHSLATGLSLLRGRLGPDAFDKDRDTVRLIAGHVDTDLRQFEGGITLDLDDPDDLAGVALGPFLDDFDIDDSPDFQLWKETQRAHLMPMLHSALTARIDHFRRCGDSRSMAAVSQRLHRVDELSEEVVRAQLESRAMAGDRIGALRVFDRWRERLSDELGATPAPALERIAERLRRNHWNRAPRAALAPVPTEHWKERVFVGRAAEFAACYEIWQRVRGGEARHVMLRGETGVGKTTLAERFLVAIALEGAAVVRAKCYRLERELPFAVIGGIVNQLLELPGAGGASPQDLAELGRLVPKVRERFPTLPEPVPAVGESVRILFTEALMALLGALAEEQPLAIAIDDVQLSDAASLAVLHLMLRRLPDLPVMVILAAPDDSRIDSEPVRQFVESRDLAAMTMVPVTPLPDDEAERLLAALLPRAQASPTLQRAILAGSRGNPMVIELLVADAARRGDASLALAMGSMTDSHWLATEETFRYLLTETLSTLDAESRSVAELGAMLGQRLNDLSMYTLVDLPAGRTLRAMTALVGRRMLRDAGQRLEFTNEFIRGQCYLSMSAPMRRLLHGAVADRLLARDGSEEAIPALEIAWHLVRGDRLKEAVPYLLTGGRVAIRSAAPHEAELALSTGLPALSGDARRTAILLLAEAQQELGQWAASLHTLELGDNSFDYSQSQCREVYRTIAKRWLGRLSPRDKTTCASRLLEITRGTADPEVRVKALAASLRLVSVTRDASQILELDDSAKHLDSLELPAFERVHVILVQAWISAARFETESALAQLAHGIEIAGSASVMSSIVVRLLIGRGALLCANGKYADAIPVLAHSTKLAERLDNLTLQAECVSQLALATGRMGRFQDQIDYARKALSLFPEQDMNGGVLGATYELGLGLLADGRMTEARAAIFDLMQRRRGVPAWIAQATLLCGADLAALAGNKRLAISAAKKATTGEHAKIHNRSYAGQFARWVSILALRGGNPAEGLARIKDEFPDRKKLDQKDQVEILAATESLQGALRLPHARTTRAMNVGLNELPPLATMVMRKLRADRNYR